MSIITSNSSSNTSFSEKIKKKLTRTPTAVMEDNWLIFLKDHRNYIRLHSKLIVISPEERIKYNHKLRTFLSAQTNVDLGVQAFLVANDYLSEDDFDVTNEYFLCPTNTSINQLRKLYKTHMTKRASVITD